MLQRAARESDPAPARSLAGRLLRLAVGRAQPAIADASLDPERQAIAEWKAKAQATGDALQRAAYHALARVVSALMVRHGQVWGSHELLVAIATDLAWNEFGSD